MGAAAIRCWVGQRRAQSQMKKWMLEFDQPDVESAFIEYDDGYWYDGAIFALRVGVAFTVVFAGIDVLVLHHGLLTASIIRLVTTAVFGIAILGVRAGLVGSHTQVASVLLLTFVLLSLGPALALGADFPVEYLRTSASVTLLGAIGLLRLRLHAVMAMIGIYLAVCLTLPGVWTGVDTIGTQVAPTFGMATITWLIAYALERLRRTDFQQQREVQLERARSEEILHNVLPASIAERLRLGAVSIADSAPSVSVLFSDIVGFTPVSETLSPEELVQLLDTMFREFDELCDQRGIEKIKTVGDAYMAVAGIPTADADHAASAAELALDMQRTLSRLSSSWPSPISMRIGIASGPVVAGVIGQRKFTYDLWGDTVNTASRMESSGRPHRIQVSESTHALLEHRYAFSDPQLVDIKGKGPMTTYYLLGALV